MKTSVLALTATRGQKIIDKILNKIISLGLGRRAVQMYGPDNIYVGST